MKKAWNAPQLVNHGNVEAITSGIIVLKERGAGDDLAATIASVSTVE